MLMASSPRMGRPTRGRDALRGRVFCAVTVADERALRAVAKRYRVTVAQLVRWWAEEAISGEWTPSHLERHR